MDLSQKFSFQLLKADGETRARAGVVNTPHGRIETPVFMPVGTLATVKTLSPQDLSEIGAQIILGNTYHLLLRPGIEVFRKFGGIHKFMNWKGPVLTDSGGFQIFSLPRARTMTEEGAVFQSYIEGDTYRLSPELSIEMQNAIGSDVMMVLDQCIESTAPHEATRLAMELTHRWALRSLKAHEDFVSRSPWYQALFAIVQGGVHRDLRKQSADFLTQLPFDGFAIGGLAVGESKEEREEHTEIVTELLPKDKPRYLMGVGTPIDLLEAVRRGVDMFDCIIPTKLAQQGVVYTSRGEVKLQQGAYRLTDDKLDENCACHTCAQYSRGYLHHLTKCRETLGWRALSLHNSFYFQNLMRGMRQAILENRFMSFYATTIENWKTGTEELSAEMTREASIFHPPRKNKNKGKLESQIIR